MSDAGLPRAFRPGGSAPGEDDELSQSLAGLAQLSTGRMSLEQLLTRVAQYAVQAIPRADGAGLTLLEEDRVSTIVTTTTFVAEVDAMQYSLGQGPCIIAVREGVLVQSGSLGDDSRWSRLGGRATQLGVHSVLSLPLRTADGVVGALNLYALANDAFDEAAAEVAELFAGPAAAAVQNAQVLDQTRRLAARLQAALEEKVVVERAVGIIMSRSGATEAEANRQLQALSARDDRRLVVTARGIVDEAVRRARARPAP